MAQRSPSAPQEHHDADGFDEAQGAEDEFYDDIPDAPPPDPEPVRSPEEQEFEEDAHDGDSFDDGQPLPYEPDAPVFVAEEDDENVTIDFASTRAGIVFGGAAAEPASNPYAVIDDDDTPRPRVLVITEATLNVVSDDVPAIARSFDKYFQILMMVDERDVQIDFANAREERLVDLLLNAHAGWTGAPKRVQLMAGGELKDALEAAQLPPGFSVAETLKLTRDAATKIYLNPNEMAAADSAHDVFEASPQRPAAAATASAGDAGPTKGNSSQQRLKQLQERYEKKVRTHTDLSVPKIEAAERALGRVTSAASTPGAIDRTVDAPVAVDAQATGPAPAKTNDTDRRAYLRDVRSGMTIPLTKPEIIIGRADGNTITVKMPTVSKRNTRIVREDGVFKIEDLRSTNGTYLNGMRVGKKVRITDGAQIVIGKTAQLPGGAREYVFELK
jgi:hypothetical protein